MDKNCQLNISVNVKPPTVLTNLQRGNVKQETPMLSYQRTVHELAAQGELLDVELGSVDIKDSNNLTPLIWAAGYGQNTTVEYLLNLGANPNHKSLGSRTAMMYAAAKGFLNVVKTLIKGGSRIDDVDDSGNSALMYAAHQNHFLVIEELLKQGANFVITNVYSQTAYSICVSKNNTGALKTFNKYLLDILWPTILQSPPKAKSFSSNG